MYEVNRCLLLRELNSVFQNVFSSSFTSFKDHSYQLLHPNTKDLLFLVSKLFSWLTLEQPQVDLCH